MFCCLRTCFHGHLRKPTGAKIRQREPEIHFDAAHMGEDVIILSNQLRVTGSGGVLATAPLVQSKSYFEIKIQQSGSWCVGLATRQTDLKQEMGGGDRESWCLCSDNSTRHNGEEFRPVVMAADVKTNQPLLQQQQQHLTSVNGILSGNINEAAAAGLISIEDVPEDNQPNVAADSDVANAQVTETTTASEHLFPGEGDIVGIAFDHIELNFFFNGTNLEVPFRNIKGAVYPVVYVGKGTVIDLILDNFHYGPPPGFDRIMLEQSLL